MRWLLIALLVSLAGLLIAAAGMARHIWLQRTLIRSKPSAEVGNALDSASGEAEENKAERKI
jgi:hypothetical protein